MYVHNPIYTLAVVYKKNIFTAIFIYYLDLKWI